MLRHRRMLTLWVVTIAALSAALPVLAGRPRHEDPGSQLFTSPQSNPVALQPGRTRQDNACPAGNHYLQRSMT